MTSTGGKVAGYGRYKDDQNHVGCPYAKSDMTPCISRDGAIALGDDGNCIGCWHSPIYLLRELANEYEPARKYLQTKDPKAIASRLTEMVRNATEPS